MTTATAPGAQSALRRERLIAETAAKGIILAGASSAKILDAERTIAGFIIAS